MANEQTVDLHAVFDRFAAALRPTWVEALGNHGGFSGARLWRVHAPAGRFCLRAWPPGQPGPGAIDFMHGLLDHLSRQGIRFVPAPLRTIDGVTYIQHLGRYWQLEPWLGGEADFRYRPTDERLRAAMTALAQLHRAAATFTSSTPTGHSASMERRLRELRAMIDGQLGADLHRIVPDGRWPEMDRLSRRVLDRIRLLTRDLQPLLNRPLPWVPLQPVIRDVWHDHVLFEEDDVSGIIDFGSAGIDSVAIDVARLLGSLVGDDERRWRLGLEAYAAGRPLSPEERELVWLSDMTGCFTGGLVWLRRHYLARVRFENPAAILDRVCHFHDRLAAIEPADLFPGKPFGGLVESAVPAL
jgi:Ser/Thr protein kinase RdoA (MazF antagonist)